MSVEEFIKKITQKQAYCDGGGQHESKRTQEGNFSIIDFPGRLKYHMSSKKTFFRRKKVTSSFKLLLDKIGLSRD
jgi:hypothetical protein